MNYFAFLTVRCILYHDLAFIFSVYHDLPNSFVSYSIIPCFFVSYTWPCFSFVSYIMDLLFFCFFIQYHELLYQHLCSFYCFFCHNLSIKTLLLSFLFFLSYCFSLVSLPWPFNINSVGFILLLYQYLLFFCFTTPEYHSMFFLFHIFLYLKSTVMHFILFLFSRTLNIICFISWALNIY